MGSAQVYLQRGKLLLALQAVRKGIALAGQSHPQVHHMAVQLCQRAQSQQQVSTPPEWGLLRDRGVIVCVTGSSAVSARSYLECCRGSAVMMIAMSAVSGRLCQQAVRGASRLAAPATMANGSDSAETLTPLTADRACPHNPVTSSCSHLTSHPR